MLRSWKKIVGIKNVRICRLIYSIGKAGMEKLTIPISWANAGSCPVVIWVQNLCDHCTMQMNIMLFLFHADWRTCLRNSGFKKWNIAIAKEFLLLETGVPSVAGSISNCGRLRISGWFTELNNVANCRSKQPTATAKVFTVTSRPSLALCRFVKYIWKQLYFWFSFASSCFDRNEVSCVMRLQFAYLPTWSGAWLSSQWSKLSSKNRCNIGASLSEISTFGKFQRSSTCWPKCSPQWNGSENEHLQEHHFYKCEALPLWLS